MKSIIVDDEKFYLADSQALQVAEAIRGMGLPIVNPGRLVEVRLGRESFYVVPRGGRNNSKISPDVKIITELIRIFGGSTNPKKVRTSSLDSIEPRRNRNLLAALDRYIETHDDVRGRSGVARKIVGSGARLFKMDQTIITQEKAELIRANLDLMNIETEDFLII